MAALKSRVNLLLILRGIAALAVVCWHIVGYKAEIPAAVNLPGRTAVWLFFGISGYVIAYGFVHRRYRLNPGGLTDFFTNRFLRIYPLFFGLSLLCWATSWWIKGTSPLGPADIPAQFLAWQFNQNYILCGVFWTLGIELQFYLIAPLLALPLLPRIRYALPLLLVVFALIAYGYEHAILDYAWSRDGRNIVSNLQHFVAGMFGCRLVAEWRPPRWLSPIAGVLAASVLAYTNWLYHRRPVEYWSSSGLLLVDAAILLLVVAHAGLERTSVRRTQPAYWALTWVGVLSYGVYAWHGYILTYYPWTLDRLLTVVALSLLGAYVTYRLVERPAHRLKRHPAIRPGETLVDGFETPDAAMPVPAQPA